MPPASVPPSYSCHCLTPVRRCADATSSCQRAVISCRGGRARVEFAGGAPIDHAAGEELPLMNESLQGRRHSLEHVHCLPGETTAGDHGIQDQDMR